MGQQFGLDLAEKFCWFCLGSLIWWQSAVAAWQEPDGPRWFLKGQGQLHGHATCAEFIVLHSCLLKNLLRFWIIMGKGGYWDLYILSHAGGWCGCQLSSSKRLAHVSSHDDRSFPRQWQQSLQGFFSSGLTIPTSSLLLHFTDQSKSQSKPRY